MCDDVSCVYRSPLGTVKLVANAHGICAVKFLFGAHGRKVLGCVESEGETERELAKAGATLLPGEPAKGDREALQHLNTCVTWLDTYFGGTLSKEIAKPCLVFPQESNFFNHVWSVLASTGVGETLSYKELAKLAGRPQAARAVGRAMKSNPLPILVPCHRVIKSNKRDIGSYSGGEGTQTKQWLLDHEKKVAAHVTSNTAS